MQTTKSPRRFMTLGEVASLWEVSKATVRRWADSGDLPVVVLPGGRRCYERHLIESDYEARTGRKIVKGG